MGVHVWRPESTLEVVPLGEIVSFSFLICSKETIPLVREIGRTIKGQ